MTLDSRTSELLLFHSECEAKGHSRMSPRGCTLRLLHDVHQHRKHGYGQRMQGWRGIASTSGGPPGLSSEFPLDLVAVTCEQCAYEYPKSEPCFITVLI